MSTTDNIKPTNWNKIEDPIDKDVWDRMTANFWLPEKIALSNDIPSWNTLSDAEKEATRKIFAGLTTLDTLQANVGAAVLAEDAVTSHEAANFTFIGAMESIHAKSYSSIFSTLCSTEEINEVFRWASEDSRVQFKAMGVFNDYKYQRLHRENPIYGQAMVKAASVILESFLFYSGFYLPFKFASQGKLSNTADIIRLILRDEAVHGFYIGYKYQRLVAQLPAAKQDQLLNDVKFTLNVLYENELRFTEEIYDDLGWTEGVKRYLRYNANKAMNNLGYEGMFPANDSQPEAAILTAMSPDANETHDFFSGQGSSYVIGTVEATSDDDWA